MSPEPTKDAHDEGGYGPHMKTVALAILTMGLSLVVVIVLWMGFGHIGPSFSSNLLQQQQATLRQKYGLPAQQTSSAELEIPPSLRGLEKGTSGATSTASNAGGSNNTTASNQTAANTTSAGNKTSAAGIQTGGGTVAVTITPGSSSKTTDAFSPNPVNAKVGDTVTWTNKDSTPHTVVSGTNAKPDGKFDSSPGFKNLIAPGQTFSHKFTEAGQYPYFCQLHPNMVGTVSVS
jgi:plastocyanin